VELDVMAGGEVCELRIVGEKVVQPFSMSRPFAMQLLRIPIHSGGKRPPCVATPTSAVVGLKRSASSTARDDGNAFVELARLPVRVEDRDDVVSPVASTPRAVLP